MADINDTNGNEEIDDGLTEAERDLIQDVEGAKFKAELHYLWDQKEDIDFLKQYASFRLEEGKMRESVNARVHAMALKFNNPKFGATAADKFREYVKDLAAQLNKEFHIDVVVYGFSTKDDDVRIKGNGAFPQAFKRVYNAMYHGGDLTVLDTVGKCQKFASEAEKKDQLLRERNKRFDEIGMQMAEEEEWKDKEDTPEFRQEVMKRYSAQEQVKKAKEEARKAISGEIQPDPITERMLDMADKIKRLMEVDEATVEDMVSAFEARINKQMDLHFGSKMQEALKAGGSK